MGRRSNSARAIAFGVAAGLAVVSKFSILVFLPATLGVAAVLWLACHGITPERFSALRRSLPTLGIAILAGAFLIWATYRFSFHGVPAPELFQGIADARAHNQQGHAAYLLGEVRQGGRWQFFPILLAFKTPLALPLVVALWAILPALRGRWRAVLLPLSFSIAVLGVGMASNINIGLRHILPIYIGIAILAGAALEQLTGPVPERRWAAPLLGFLMLWFGASSLLAHPDYLAYFNELAGGKPEEIAVDSDLEWGQDLKRVAARLRAANATSLALFTFIRVDEKEQGLPPLAKSMERERPPAGWTAIDITNWIKTFGRNPDSGLWFNRIPPTEKVGAGYYLWYFPPAPSLGDGR